jgi:outer membrane protein assembly factor BamB
MTRSLSLIAVILTTTFASADDWPQWMGPGRDDVWTETGIIDEFPEGGLTFL